jgi:hypothetical protein
MKSETTGTEEVK